jgi:cysteinyl-tRNA synthetase
MKYLGRTLDIHGGGLDLQFPHHENELAQSESYSGQVFARYWMHNGLLKMGHSKMAGSVGNVVNIADLLRKHPAQTVRFLLLSTHYRSPIEFEEGDKRLAEMQRGLDGFYRFFERYQRITGQDFLALGVPWTLRKQFDADWANGPDWNEFVLLRQKFFDCMDDDFNTAGGIGVLYELLTALNRFAEKKQLEGAGQGQESARGIFQKGVIILRELSQILGLFWETPSREKAGSDQLVDGLMQLLLDLRAEARKAKNFALADQIRKRLTDLGVTLEDRPGGTGWRVG